MIVTTEGINQAIRNAKTRGFSAKGISDGYHTFQELYDHRVQLWIQLTDLYGKAWSMGVVHQGDGKYPVWKSKLHSDGTMFDDMFILGLTDKEGRHLTYHLDLSYWDEAVATELEFAPEWDGHSPEDVIQRLKELFK